MPFRYAFAWAIMLAAPLFASDQSIADTLAKDGVKIKLDNGVAMSALFDEKSMNKKDPTVAQFKLIGQLTGLKSLTVYNKCPLTDDTISVLDGLESLESAAINAMNISDKGFEHLAKWKKLKKLTLWHVFNKSFNGSGSALLAALPELESYNCSGSTFNDEGLKACAQLKQIARMTFGHTAVTSEGLAYLKGLENLKELTLTTQYSMRIDDNALPYIAAVPNLEKLELGETLLTNFGLKHLKNLTKLKELSLKEVAISDEDYSKLKADLPSVNIGVTKPKPENEEKMKAELGKKKKR